MRRSHFKYFLKPISNILMKNWNLKYGNLILFGK